MSSITPATNIETVDRAVCSAGREKTSSSERRPATLFSFGEDSETPALTSEPASPSPASTVQRFATLEKQRAATLYAKRIELLISAGLIVGITPTSVRTTLGADCREPVSSLLVGDMYESKGDGREQKNEDS